MMYVEHNDKNYDNISFVTPDNIHYRQPFAISDNLERTDDNEKYEEYKNDGYSRTEAKKKAEAWVAVPGTSEHQLGLAVDINADTSVCSKDAVYDWLDQNSYKYGFIHRYPSDKTDITGVINEPWHYRYVGVEAATEIHEKGITLEEYLDET